MGGVLRDMRRRFQRAQVDAKLGASRPPGVFEQGVLVPLEKRVGGDGRPDDPPRRLCSQWTTEQAH
jgi:hypothetical protein